MSEAISIIEWEPDELRAQYRITDEDANQDTNRGLLYSRVETASSEGYNAAASWTADLEALVPDLVVREQAKADDEADKQNRIDSSSDLPAPEDSFRIFVNHLQEDRNEDPKAAPAIYHGWSAYLEIVADTSGVDLSQLQIRDGTADYGQINGSEDFEPSGYARLKSSRWGTESLAGWHLQIWNKVSGTSLHAFTLPQGDYEADFTVDLT